MRDRARTALLEIADVPAHVGELLDSERSGDITVLRFASLHPGYPGWHWSVAVVGEGDGATINEIWMEPGHGALTVPAWKPWAERVRPGDLGPGDVIATSPDDPRLEPGYAAVDDLEVLAPQWEIGLGRSRVLSAEGLLDAADRWRSGEDGPDAQIARLVDVQCSTCAWLLPIGGPMGQAFGACANAMSPSDGHIVAMDHGCGAHSDMETEPSPVPVTEMLIDDERFELVRSAAEPIASADDVARTDEANEDAGPSDVTPPQDAELIEPAAQ